MEKQYVVNMTITVDDDDVPSGQTISDLVLEALEEAPFQVDVITVS